jgi:hypothetical protein
MKRGIVAVLTALLAFSASGSLRDVRVLDGTWRILFDEENQGRRLGWQSKETFQAMETREITVPSCWEEIELDYEGVAIYGTVFEVPAEWDEKVVQLQFDAVNYIAEVWLNDFCVGRHEGGYGPFAFRVDEFLYAGEENFLSVRVVGPIVTRDDLVIDGLGKNDAPHWRGAIVGGIWQSVRLVASDALMIEDVFVIPQLKDDTVRIQLSLDNTQTTHDVAEVEITVSYGEALVAQVQKEVPLQPGRNQAEWTLSIPDVKYWSPDEPHLYTATVRVLGSDEEQVRFGMREMTIRGKEFVLNDEPIYIKAAFFEGLYPTKLAVPDTLEMARQEIQLAKEAGFNMIRPWRKPPPPAWLDLCDEMGMLVIGGLPIECMKLWPTVTPDMPRRIEQEVRTAILRDRNRACIVQWEMFNEIWRKELKLLKHPMSMLARELDPSRLILDESGGFADGANIYLPYEVEPITFNDIHIYCGAPINDDTYDSFLALGMTPDEMRSAGFDPKKVTNKHAKAGLMSLVSEIGYGSIPNVVENNKRFREEGNPLVPAYSYHQMLEETTKAVLKESGLDAIYPDLQTFIQEQQLLHSDANKRMIEAIRSNPMIRGYCVHALTGGDWVLGAGLLDLWRNPKEAYVGTKEANAPQYVAVRVMPRNNYAGEPLALQITGINDWDAVEGCLEVRVISEKGKVVKKWQENVHFTAGVSKLLRERLDSTSWSGAYRVEVRLTDRAGKNMAENRFDFDVYDALALRVPQAEVAVLDPENQLKPFLRKRGIAYEEFSETTAVSVPVFVVANKASSPALKKRFQVLETFVDSGGTAVYLNALVRGGSPYWAAQLPSDEVLPITKDKVHALGLWVGVSHVVTDHPVFEGLPLNSMMGQEYENVWSPYVLKGMGNDLIVGSVSYGFYASNTDQQSYVGPEPAFYGMDMGVVQYGAGRYILNTLRLVENLDKDPVADKILYNLIRWTTQ